MKLATDGAVIKTIAHLESEPRPQGTRLYHLLLEKAKGIGI